MTSPPQPLNPPKPSLEQKLAQDQAAQQKWSAVAQTPDLSPAAMRVVINLSRSYGAAARLSQKALAHQQRQQQQQQANSSPNPSPTMPAQPPCDGSNPAPLIIPQPDVSLSGLSGAQLKAAWIQGQTLAALSLAQQESAKAGEPMPSAGMNKSETLGKSINGMTKSKLAAKTRKVLRILVGLIIGCTVIFLAQGTLAFLFYFFFITNIGQYIFVIGLVGGWILVNNPGITKALMRFWKWINS